MNTKYREGFFDGMRYSGGLLEDIPDKEITPSHDCITYMNTKYEERTGSTDSEYRFIKRLVEDADRLYDENAKLRELLAIARQELKGGDKVKPNYLELV